MTTPDDPRSSTYLADLLTELLAATGEVGALAYLHTLVVRLADEADGMTAGRLREEIRRIAEQVRDRESVRRAGEVTR